MLSFIAMSMALGCGQSSDKLDPAVRTVGSAQLDLAAPLTEQDVALFLQIVERLPDRQVPAFLPGLVDSPDASLPADQIATALRSEYQRQFSPEEQARDWYRQPELMRAFDASGTTPEQFASLATRISCALTADALQRRLDLPAETRQAEERLAGMLQSWGAPSANHRPAHGHVVVQDRETSVQMLREILAFAEFSRLLSTIPGESCAVVRSYRSQLDALLPHRETAEAFERTIESQPRVIPVSHRQLR